MYEAARFYQIILFCIASFFALSLSSKGYTLTRANNTEAANSFRSKASTQSHFRFDQPSDSYIPVKNNEYTNQNFLGNINALDAYSYLDKNNKNVAGDGVVVGVIDEGITNHLEFAEKLPDKKKRIHPQSNYVSYNKTAGVHGTSVASFINASPNSVNSNGIGMHGVAFNSQVLMVNFNESSATSAVSKILKNSGSIINASWGLPISNAPEIKDVRLAVKSATDKGITWVSAAGNGISNGGSISSGIDYPTALALHDDINSSYNSLLAASKRIKSGTHTSADLKLTSRAQAINVTALNEDKIANWTTFCGVTKRYCLAAPGHMILGAAGSGYNDYEITAGTSFSAPIVSGSLAVLMSAFPELKSMPWKYSEILLQSADPKYLTSSITDSDNNQRHVIPQNNSKIIAEKPIIDKDGELIPSGEYYSFNLYDEIGASRCANSAVCHTGTKIKSLPQIENMSGYTLGGDKRYYDYGSDTALASACAKDGTNCDENKAVLSTVYGWGNLNLLRAVQPIGKHEVIVNQRNLKKDLRTTSMSLPKYFGDVGKRISDTIDSGVFFDKFDRIYDIDLSSKITKQASRSLSDQTTDPSFSAIRVDSSSFGFSNNIPDFVFILNNRDNSGKNLMFNTNQRFSSVSDLVYTISPKTLKELGTSFRVGINQNSQTIDASDFSNRSVLDTSLVSRSHPDNPFLSFNPDGYHKSVSVNQRLGKRKLICDNRLG